MPPKHQYTRDSIEQAAFAIAQERGLDSLSARAIAKRLGCSTTPIYSVFENMGQLEDMVCERSAQLMLEYQTRKRTGAALVDMCLGYVLFAVEQAQLFRDMFLNKDKLSEHSQLIKQQTLDLLFDKIVTKDATLDGLPLSRKREILDLLWTYSHGLAAQMNIGAVPVASQSEITEKLHKVIDPLLNTASC